MLNQPEETYLSPCPPSPPSAHRSLAPRGVNVVGAESAASSLRALCRLGVLLKPNCQRSRRFSRISSVLTPPPSPETRASVHAESRWANQGMVNFQRRILAALRAFLGPLHQKSTLQACTMRGSVARGEAIRRRHACCEHLTPLSGEMQYGVLLHQ